MKRIISGLLIAILFISILPASTTLAACGRERWPVKTGTDLDASLVDVSSPTPTTIASMRQLPAPPRLPQDVRISPTETTVFVINATLIAYKLEAGDSDYHVVISDEDGNTMITEIPSPSCVGATSPFTAAIAHARSQFDAQLHANGSFQTASIPVQVTGVGFFDFLHGQRGVAPNGIELHPVLDIVFNPDLQNPPETTPEATPAGSGQWEYQFISASTAETLLNQLNALTDNWELVSVVVDDQRTDRYIAYLKRLR